VSRLLLGRSASLLLTLLITSVIVFALTSVVPGDVARRILGREAPQSAVDAKRAELGLDQPLVTQYWRWFGGFVRGDWGESYTKGEPVFATTIAAVQKSLVLGLIAFAVLVPVALVLGLIAGFRPGSRLDRAIVVGGLTGTATPEFVSGVLLLVVFSVNLGWLPPSSRSEYGLRGLVLPALCLVLVTFGYVTRMVRASVIDTTSQPWVRTARLKGLSTSQLMGRHVLRNSLIVPTTALGLQLRYMIGGLVTVEVLFSYAGVGSLLLNAALEKDVPTLQAATMVSGAIILVTFLLNDVLYALLDPRVRLGATT
jgi:peptide/nickel transport system permease protein